MAPKFLVSYPTIGRHWATSVGSRFVLKRFVSKEIEFRSILLNKNSFAKFKSIHRLVLDKEDEMLRKYWSSSFFDLVNQKSTTSKKMNLRVPRLLNFFLRRIFWSFLLFFTQSAVDHSATAPWNRSSDISLHVPQLAELSHFKFYHVNFKCIVLANRSFILL